MLTLAFHRIVAGQNYATLTPTFDPVEPRTLSKVAPPYKVVYIVTMEIDYRELLKKYINHVGEEEGTTFLAWADESGRFTDEELTELRVLDDEGLKELGKKQ